MNPKSNYFFVSRELLHSDRWLDEPFTRGQAWIDLFGLANHQSGHIRVRGLRVDVARGQLAWSQETLAKRWQWSRGKVKRFLNELEKYQDVVQQTDRQISVITICKYDLWQGSSTKCSTTDRQATDRQRTPDGTRTRRTKELKNKVTTNVVKSPPAADVAKIFDFYVKSFETPTTKLTPSRKAKIKARLKDSGEEMLLAAINGAANSPFHRGENDRGWIADIDFIIRSYEQVEKLAKLSQVSEAIATNGHINLTEEQKKRYG